MKQAQFEARYRSFWQQFAVQLYECEHNNRLRLNLSQAEQLLSWYTDVCQHLAWAMQRDYSAGLVDFLQNLTERGHRQVYRFQSRNLVQRFVQFVRHDFPTMIRAQKKVVYAAHALFYVPFLLALLLAFWQPDVMVSITHADQVENSFKEMAERYQKGVNRPFSDNIQMVCVYINNNIGIAFQSFAGGLVLGVGSALITVYNGFFLGAVMGYMVHSDAGKAFFSFVIAHGAFELTGIVLASAGGLRLGLALLAPGHLSRKEALKQQGHDAAMLMCGAFAMIAMAAFIEAFWSPLTSIPIFLKWIVGLALWLLVYVYFWRAGR